MKNMYSLRLFLNGSVWTLICLLLWFGVLWQLCQFIYSLYGFLLIYLQEDLGEITDTDLELIKSSLPSYYEKHLNNDLLVYVARDEDDIVSCAFLLIVEKPMSPSFITGKTGTVV